MLVPLVGLYCCSCEERSVVAAKPLRPSDFRFERHDTIGSADADDDAFLADCFVDSGDLAFLRDFKDNRRIILGNTGTGKTALLSRLKEIGERVVEVQPEQLALGYVSNSTILDFISRLGVDLDVFFRLLWRHVFAVELLKQRFDIRDDGEGVGASSRLLGWFKGPKFRRAIEYLEKWGRNFWEDTEKRVKEITRTLEDKVDAAVKAKFPTIDLAVADISRLTEQQKYEIVHRAQRIVNEAQVRQLADIPDLLNAALDDPQKRYYIVIDRLDVNWVDDNIRHRLIRALIETIRDLFKVTRVKIIIALRVDLIERVFSRTRDSGFQQEKYESLYLTLDWQEEQLTTLMDARIANLVRRRYTKQRVTHRDILPQKIGTESGLQYILSRTMMRPRDVILFVNQCIQKASGNSTIGASMVREAEGEYSRLRLRSLADEWYGDYPNLLTAADLLKGFPRTFRVDAITHNRCADICLALTLSGAENDWFLVAAKEVVYGNMDPREFCRAAILVCYKVGLVGLRLDSSEAVQWSRGARRSVSSAEVADDTRVAVHKAFWRVLGIRE
jgi:hypothetical protein